jgi:cell division septum initiation protein DivIVA
MARKSGYEVLEVDEFVDEVEESFAQLIEENQSLKKQVDSLKASPPAAAGSGSQESPAPATEQAPLAEPTPPASPANPVVPGAIVVTTAKEASSAVVRLVEMATEQSERLVAEATDDANRIREEANRTAHQVTTDARTRAERVESESRVNAERVQADALSRAEKLDREIEGRRSEMFGDLERQRDELTATVSSLRTFEATYRSNLTSHLRGQIESLESGHAEPSDPPEVVRDLPPVDGSSNGAAAGGDGEAPDPATEGDAPDPATEGDAPTLGGGSPTSNTPRLDALLGDQR